MWGKRVIEDILTLTCAELKEGVLIDPRKPIHNLRAMSGDDNNDPE